MKDKRRVYLFFAAIIIFNMAANFAHPVTPTIIKERGFGDYMFGVALASMMAVNFLFSPFWGRMITHISSRRVALICGVGYAIGQVMFGLAPTEATMVAARMFAGIFTSGAFTSFLTYVVNTSPEEMRGNYLTVSATLSTVAASFGFFVGGMLGEISISMAIIAQVITLAGCGVLFYLICEDDTPGGAQRTSPIALFRDANPLAAFIAGRGFMTPLFMTIFLVAALANLGSLAFDQSFNYYLKAQLGLSSGYNGAIKALIGFVSFAANSTIGLWLINKTDIRRSSIYVFLLCSCAMVTVVLLDAVVPFVVANVVYFGFYAISVPLTQSLVASRARGKDSNLIMGYYNGLKSLGGIFGSLSAGVLYTLNPKWPFVLGLAAFALATLAAVVYYRLSIRDERSTI
ncbi:MAG: MFS transporter [Bacillota bacterium]